LYPDICLTTEEKAWKNLIQGKKNPSQVKKNLSQGSNISAPTPPFPPSSKSSLSSSFILLVLKLEALNHMYSYSNHKTENGQ
jgi:hypothetical protein